ncbi:NAD(P)-binding protein [Adlercreutzia sp. ZJ141]|uniref:NAD(P)-binding protein n=1 Tax=Adlercreutzia sp. ZJ141 TaxID=2709406 RepID=UPI0013ECD08C|nr:NAD(P)-binding protein [Adlercreutzia sp. ZJ141]
MSKLSVAPASRADAKIAGFMERYQRRIEATPPGTCPVAVQLTLLEAGASQTCGKCVPCRDGLPQLAAMIKRVLDCDADKAALDEIRSLATMIRDSADCAIGYNAAADVLDGLDAFAAEYESHVMAHTCCDDIAQKVPCEAMCPAHVNVPAYIALVAEGDYAGAVQMVRKDNPFPTACALVCEHPCEERCRRTLIDAPINIRGIKKYAVDSCAADKAPVPARLPESGRKVAVVGAGPSGLTCAYYLALMGHAVDVFESRDKLGGMLRYGIPAYRFPRERLDEDVNAILSVGGITVTTNCYVDADKMRELADSYDAVYVAIGAHTGKSLRLENIDAQGVSSAVDLLRAIGDGDYPDFTGKKVAIIGGGNVAMDCCRTSVRAGAEEVTCVYRRRLEDMTALPAEVEGAMAEGVEMVTLEAPVAIEVDGEGKVCGLRTQPQMIGEVKRGRPAPVTADKPENHIDADIILIAVGQDIVSAPFEEFGMPAERGCFRASEGLEAEGLEGVFVGGDCQTGPASAIMAIGAGKVAARNIDAYLGYNHTLDCGVEAPAAKPNNRTACGRVNITERPARERKRDFEYIENPMSREEAVQECGRCLRCDHYGCGVLEGGRIQYV